MKGHKLLQSPENQSGFVSQRKKSSCLVYASCFFPQWMTAGGNEMEVVKSLAQISRDGEAWLGGKISKSVVIIIIITCASGGSYINHFARFPPVQTVTQMTDLSIEMSGLSFPIGGGLVFCRIFDYYAERLRRNHNFSFYWTQRDPK